MNKCWLGARTAAKAGDNHTRASAPTPSNASAHTENAFPGGCSFGLPRNLSGLAQRSFRLSRRNGLAETPRLRAVPDNAGDGRSHRGGQFRSRRRDADVQHEEHRTAQLSSEVRAAPVTASEEAAEEAVAEAEEAAEAVAEAEAPKQEESLAASEGRYRSYLDNPFSFTHHSANVTFFIEAKDKKNY